MVVVQVALAPVIPIIYLSIYLSIYACVCVCVCARARVCFMSKILFVQHYLYDSHATGAVRAVLPELLRRDQASVYEHLYGGPPQGAALHCALADAHAAAAIAR